eukprot:5837386-Amphidinium_carterae.2
MSREGRELLTKVHEMEHDAASTQVEDARRERDRSAREQHLESGTRVILTGMADQVQALSSKNVILVKSIREKFRRRPLQMLLLVGSDMNSMNLKRCTEQLCKRSEFNTTVCPHALAVMHMSGVCLTCWLWDIGAGNPFGQPPQVDEPRTDLSVPSFPGRRPHTTSPRTNVPVCGEGPAISDTIASTPTASQPDYSDVPHMAMENREEMCLATGSDSTALIFDG